MPLIAHTDGQIMPFGDDTMHLLDPQNGAQIASATRTPQGHWLIHIDGVDDITADTRSEAIEALKTQAMTKLEKPGFSVTFPRGLRDMP